MGDSSTAQNLKIRRFGLPITYNSQPNIRFGSIATHCHKFPPLLYDQPGIFVLVANALARLLLLLAKREVV